MSRALKAGAPRILRRHSRVYGRHYAELARRFGPLDGLARSYAGAVAAWWCAWRDDAEALRAAQEARELGKGRRPSVQAIARLQRRAGLSWTTYDAGLRRLEELASQQPRPTDRLADLRLAAARRGVEDQLHQLKRLTAPKGGRA